MRTTVCSSATRSHNLLACNKQLLLRNPYESRSRPRCVRYSTAQPRKSLLQDICERSSHDNTLILHSTSSNPYNNLALEHYLLTTTDPSSRILLFYTNRPCVVIGRNQNPWIECNLKLLQNQSPTSIDVVRRRSGGGTVFHDDGNLNFSVIIPNDGAFTRRKHAEMVAQALKTPILEHFARHRLFEDVWVNDRHDITITRDSAQYKVSGSAFKLTRGRALHHGTLLHSSPHLEKISAFLRAPGKPYIQAKGVESVRSPVSNLYDIESSRDELRTALTQAIVKEFKILYGPLTYEFYVEDQDCIDQLKIFEGIQELMTDDWKYGQTPRFEFRSKVFDGKQLSMSVNHGVIENASFNHQTLPALHMITDWRKTIGSEHLSESLIAHIEDVFPIVASTTGVEISAPDSKIAVSGKPKLVRRTQRETIEVEQHG